MYSKFFSYLITFPFEQIGWGLRKLSLSGAAGNVFAIIIYILICLIPCLILWRLKKTERFLKTDFFLPFLSVLLFAVIYYMINPGLFYGGVPGAVNTLLGSTFYSVFFGYIILRILESCRKSDAKRLKYWLRALLAAIIFLFFYVILTECLENLTVSLRLLNETDNPTGESFTAAYIFLILQCVINIIPYALAIFILFTSIRALNELLTDRYSDASVAAAKKLADLCTKSLVISVLSSMIFNILQLLFHQHLRQVSIAVSIPVFSIAFVLAVLLTTKYIRENQKLKQDNDLFI